MNKEELAKLCIPVLKELKKNFHPHTTVVIDAEGIRVEETTYGLPSEAIERSEKNEHNNWPWLLKQERVKRNCRASFSIRKRVRL